MSQSNQSAAQIVSELTDHQKYALINATRTLEVPVTTDLQKGWNVLMSMGLASFCHDYCFTWIRPTDLGEKVREQLLDTKA